MKDIPKLNVVHVPRHKTDYMYVGESVQNITICNGSIADITICDGLISDITMC